MTANDFIRNRSGPNLPGIPLARLERWSIVEITKYERDIIDGCKAGFVTFIGFRHHFLFIKISSGSANAYILTDFNGDSNVNCIHYVEKEKYLREMVQSNPRQTKTYRCRFDSIFRDVYRLIRGWRNPYSSISCNCKHYVRYILEALDCVEV
jgi:hypothetical protein